MLESGVLRGGLVGLPVPFMVMWAPSWAWIVVAQEHILQQGQA